MNCRHCKTPLDHIFCDLQTCPPSNAMLTREKLHQPEIYFPLKTYVCTNCWLVQIDEVEKAENIFNSDYTYFSSFSSSWLAHAKAYTDYMIDRFKFNSQSLIIEIASNDGYLLQYFKEKNIPVLGIEPSVNTAAVAKEKGIDTITEFFCSQLAESQLKEKADLIVGNNVLAHVPDINDFVKGVKLALKPDGVATFEFHHLCKLIEFNQFDTIYHEHFSYFSLNTVKSIFEAQELTIFDVEELSTHGGSLRIFVKHQGCMLYEISKHVSNLLQRELELGVKNLAYYQNFQKCVKEIKYNVWRFLLDAHSKGKMVIGYGAAAKGNTLLNYAGIKGNDLISFVVDASPYKQGKFLPGSQIPVVGIENIIQSRPDYIIILPWNLKSEITNQLSFCKSWGANFVTFIPELSIF